MKKCLPLEMVSAISKKYPECWNQIQIFRKGKEKGDLQWDDLCYIPIAATIAIATNGTMLTELTPQINDAQILAAVAPWRIYKQIYNFPLEMESLLFDQADDIVIPVDVLRNLPYPCVYIECQLIDGIDGFFFHFESDAKTGRLEMRFAMLTEDMDCIAYPVHMISGGSIKDGMDETFAEAKRNVDLFTEYKKQIKPPTQDDYDLICKLFQLVLYICAQNKEITEDAVTKKTYRKPKSEEQIKDKFREVQKWNLGTEISQNVRRMNQRTGVRYQYQGPSSTGTGTSKSPHVRRGHWHHYWTGKRDGERAQILKWIPPTFVNADKVEESPNVTINKI